MINNKQALQSVLIRLREVFNASYSFAVYNHGKHFYLYPPVDKRFLPTFYMLYKKDYFHNFNTEFVSFANANPSLIGWGESINKEWLEIAISLRANWLLFVHKEGIYMVTPIKLKAFCVRSDLIREQVVPNTYKSGGGSSTTVSVRETTYSFPIKILKNFNEAFNVDI